MNPENLRQNKINRAANYARDNMGDQLDIDILAEAACMSRAHFSRSFTAMYDETPARFLSRIRLESAALQLGHMRSKPVTDIAFDVGFSSPEAFSRAFYRRFGLQPRNFRYASQFGAYHFPKNQFRVSPVMADLDAFPAPGKPDGAELQIEQVPAKRLAYIRHRGPYFNLSGTLDATFERLETWAKAMGIWHDDINVYGICHNNPSLTPPQFCLYDVGVEIGADVSLNAGMSTQTVPAHRIVKLTLTQGVCGLNRAWSWLVSEWLPGRAKRAVSLSCYEIYSTKQSHAGPPQASVALCLPIY